MWTDFDVLDPRMARGLRLRTSVRSESGIAVPPLHTMSSGYKTGTRAAYWTLALHKSYTRTAPTPASASPLAVMSIRHSVARGLGYVFCGPRAPREVDPAVDEVYVAPLMPRLSPMSESPSSGRPSSSTSHAKYALYSAGLLFATDS